MASATTSKSAWKDYQENQQNKPGQFTYTQKKPTFSYDDTDLKSYYDELMNREDFSFDLDSNALYNQYKDAYTKQGQLAMMDTVGQASAMTGGYGNSYAVSAGQQAYQQNLDKLNDVVPEIYQLALEQYQMEGQNMLDLYGVATNERDFAYGKYQDDVDDFYTERDFAYGQYQDEVDNWQYDNEMLYNIYNDAVGNEQWQQEYDLDVDKFNEEVRQYNEQFAYQKQRDEVEDKQWSKEYNLQVKQFAEDIRQFDLEYELSEKEFDEMCRQFAKEHDLDVKQFEEDVRRYNLENATSGSSGSSGKSGGSSSGSNSSYGENKSNSSTQLTAADEYFVNSFGNLLSKYGYENNDEMIKKLLRSTTFNLSDDEIKLYESIFLDN